MEALNSSAETQLSCLVQRQPDTTEYDIKENTSVSKKGVSPKDKAEPIVESMRISLHSLMKILVFLYPDEEITVNTLDGLDYTILIAIENGEDEDNDGSVIYDLSDGFAYGFSDNWLEALEYVKAGVQEIWFHKMEQDAVECFDGEVVAETDPFKLRGLSDELFSEEAYHREKGND